MMFFANHGRGRGCRAAIAGLLLSCLPVLGQSNDDAFPYGIHGDSVVSIVRADGNRVFIRKAGGDETTLSRSAVNPIADFLEAAKFAVAGAEAACKPVMDQVGGVRQRLQAEFNDAFVEVACVALIGRDGLQPGTAYTLREGIKQRAGVTETTSTKTYLRNDKPILQEDRETRLRQLVMDCRNYDFSAVEKAIAHRNFVLTFIEEAARHNERQAAALGREKTWQDAQAHAQTGDELQATRRTIADIELRMQEYTRVAETIRGMREGVAALSTSLKTSFESEYLPIQQVATDLMRLYSDARAREAQGQDMAALIDPVSSFYDKWGDSWLDARIRSALGKPVTALAELDRLRAPPTVATSKAQPAQAEKKDDGCFVATAVFGSYQHPDVITFRRFRDRTLRTTDAGRAFIDWYYRTGPSMGSWLNDRPGLKPVVRLPLALAAFGLRHAWLVGGLVILYSVGVIGVRYRRRNLKRKANHATA